MLFLLLLLVLFLFWIVKCFFLKCKFFSPKKQVYLLTCLPPCLLACLLDCLFPYFLTSFLPYLLSCALCWIFGQNSFECFGEWHNSNFVWTFGQWWNARWCIRCATIFIDVLRNGQNWVQKLIFWLILRVFFVYILLHAMT